MITIVNFSSGEIDISDGNGHSVRLSRESAYRLVMAARMHSVADFLDKIPVLVTDTTLLSEVQSAFEGKTSSDRWVVKERIARLQTLAAGFVSPGPLGVVESLILGGSA